MARSLDGVLDKVAVEAVFRSNNALRATALMIKRNAANNVQLGQHARGTKTGATSGGAPWRISGDLANSIDISAQFAGSLSGRSYRIGPTSTPHSHSNATSGQIGLYLELRPRYGERYPFLAMAARSSLARVYEMYKLEFSAALWPHARVEIRA